MSAIKTAAVQDRRLLQFRAFDDVRRDLDALNAGLDAGSIRATGNWSPAQVFNHLASFLEFPFIGYPKELQPPAIIRFVLKFSKNRYLHKKMAAGVRIPGIDAGTVGMTDGSPIEALGRLRRAIDKMDSTDPRVDNPVLGPLSHEEWKALNIRHCELHLGFLHPR